MSLDQPAPRALRLSVVAAVLFVSGLFLFARLGHYALWDDEAMTAVSALGVWRTGDTTCVLGRNIVAYRSGAMLTNLKDRCSPPLMFFLAAPSLGLLGQNAWGARLPFALCGLATVALLLHWAWRARADTASWILLGPAILGNVSFFLFARQCRYYAPAILLTVAVAYGYFFHESRRSWLLTIALLSWALLATNPMNFVALYAVLAVDYVLWGGKRQPLNRVDWLWLVVPQVILGVPVVLVWNPWHSKVFAFPHDNLVVEKAILFYRNLRDLNRCEFGILPVIAIAPVLYFRDRRDWLLRAPLAFLVYVMAITAVSPQPVANSITADVRYVVPVIPLCMAIAVLALRAATRGDVLLAATLGLLAFGTNILHLDPFLRGGFRSTVCEYAGELHAPPGDPFTVAADWINEHVETGKSICVLARNMSNPLIFHAPGPIYAWQFDPETEKDFEHLEAIHFWGKQPPDYLLAFGPNLDKVPGLVRAAAPSRYEPFALLDFFGIDRHRPELFWRTFRPITGYDRNREAIFVFRRTEGEPPA
jgi:hypothetical protein